MTDARTAKLLSTRLNILVSEMSDSTRSHRGRTYALQGAVVDLTVHPGVITASVQGSRSVPYRVVIHTTEATSFENQGELVPGARDVRFACSCPDDGYPCKHGVAVMLDFAERVIDAPELLGLWRGQPQPGSGPRAAAGSRSGGRATSTATSTEPAISDDAVAALHAFLGSGTQFPIEHVSPLPPPVAAYGDMWAEMLTDALEALATEIIHPPFR
jgi:SWIM zinc finger